MADIAIIHRGFQGASLNPLSPTYIYLPIDIGTHHESHFIDFFVWFEDVLLGFALHEAAKLLCCSLLVVIMELEPAELNTEDKWLRVVLPFKTLVLSDRSVQCDFVRPLSPWDVVPRPIGCCGNLSNFIQRH